MRVNIATRICFPSAARVAELVDAADSKSAVRKNVLVRFQSRALDNHQLRKAAISGFSKFANNLQTICKQKCNLSILV